MLDLDLAERLVPAVEASLRERMLVQVEPFSTGSRSPYPRPKNASALLVVEGLLVREVQIADCAWQIHSQDLNAGLSSRNGSAGG